VLADANAVLGLTDHDYGPVTLDPNDSRYDPDTIVQHAPDSDTTDYLIPTKQLPLLAPLRAARIAPHLIDAIDPILRVLVELGYTGTFRTGSRQRQGCSRRSIRRN
jgi:hypothetical protein